MKKGRRLNESLKNSRGGEKTPAEKNERPQKQERNQKAAVSETRAGVFQGNGIKGCREAKQDDI